MFDVYSRNSSSKMKRVETRIRFSFVTAFNFLTRALLQHAILDMQLPVAARCQTRIVRDDEKRLLPIAREI